MPTCVGQTVFGSRAVMVIRAAANRTPRAALQSGTAEAASGLNNDGIVKAKTPNAVTLLAIRQPLPPGTLQQ